MRRSWVRVPPKALLIKNKNMITFITIVLSLTIIGIGLLIKEITKLKEELKEIHNRISVTDQQTHLRITKELGDLYETLLTKEEGMKSQLQSKIDKLTSQLVKDVNKLRSEIPITNDELLKEVQQMRDDFFALRQNF